MKIYQVLLNEDLNILRDEYIISFFSYKDIKKINLIDFQQHKYLNDVLTYNSFFIFSKNSIFIDFNSSANSIKYKVIKGAITLFFRNKNINILLDEQEY